MKRPNQALAALPDVLLFDPEGNPIEFNTRMGPAAMPTWTFIETGERKRSAEKRKWRKSGGYNWFMVIDAGKLHQALEYYRQWNEAELIDQARNAGKRSSKEAWRQYVALWEFAMRLGEGPGLAAQRLRAKEWAEYYEKIERFEAWRRERAEGP